MPTAEFNPWAAGVLNTKPEVPLDAGDFPLAKLWQRFAGGLIDLVLVLPLAMALFVLLALGYVRYVEGMSVGLFLRSMDYTNYLVRGTLLFISMPASFLILNSYLILKRGQTFGKFFLKTRMVGNDGQLMPLPRIVLFRYLLFWFLWFLPLIQYIIFIDALCIFGEERKCLHDDVAGTKVVSLR